MSNRPPAATPPQLPVPDEIDGEVAKIIDRASLTGWLRKKPEKIAVTIAARAAMRVAPLIGMVSRRPGDLTKAAFRSTALALAAGKYPASAIELRAAEAANSIAYDTNSDVDPTCVILPPVFRALPGGEISGRKS